MLIWLVAVGYVGVCWFEVGACVCTDVVQWGLGARGVLSLNMSRCVVWVCCVILLLLVWDCAAGCVGVCWI